GCQMNVLDSEWAMAGLMEAGYQPVSAKRHADIVLFNTCSVRQHAEDKIYSALGRLKHWKDQKPGAIIGVMGCMAQKDKEAIFQRAPHVDIILGPGQLRQLPDLVKAVERTRKRQIEVSLDRIRREHGKINTRRSPLATRHSSATVRDSFRQFNPQRLLRTRGNPYQAMVRIMFGCDKFCSYCIVPSVRGPEQSRPPQEIEAEIRQLADQGCLEVTLIGQTVNSYRYPQGEKIWRLQDLFAMIESIDGIRRVLFVTSYPRGMTDELLQAIHDLPKVMPFVHVPAQSGSNAVLQRMKRHYTVEEYRDLLDRINAIIPGAAVTSDFIVGFCGETDGEYQQTVDLVRYCRFKNSFIFKYSERPGTKAGELFDDDVPETVKKRRNNELLAIQNAISLELNEAMVGQTVEILVEGVSKTASKRQNAEPIATTLVQIDLPDSTPGTTPDKQGTVQLTGHTLCDRIVVFDGPPSLVGQILPVKIVQAAPFTLFGKQNP
ncbi:MAG: tRNA (N6-isopentenyl adenosine(37)-C2)-methylthiotransferase MiaB, partial [Planctomycetaceae bacterium]|nr:tRNA (N6-isopentenyl adenosine(37)-C2)-methylthiotransferase MiaB [Planctomycetaceae bacterium]